MRIIERPAYARAGLIGNPSDGFHGKTIAFTMRNFSARVVMYPWEHVEIVFSRQDKNRFDSLDELVQDVQLNGYYGGVRLIKAAIKKFCDYCGSEKIPLQQEPFSIRYESDIPRGVGLAGSSAIVIATLKCLAEYYDVKIADDVLASVARSVEHDELGITCGYQDRVAQAYNGMVYMDFGKEKMRDKNGYPCGEYYRLDPGGLPLLYLAYDLLAAKTSGEVHGPLAVRVRENAKLSEVMSQIADLAPPARQAIESGDGETLHQLIDRNFDLRTELYEIGDRLRLMINTARSVGASAKFAGSGGAIVGSCKDESMFAALEKALSEADSQWRVFKPELVNVM